MFRRPPPRPPPTATPEAGLALLRGPRAARITCQEVPVASRISAAARSHVHQQLPGPFLRDVVSVHLNGFRSNCKIFPEFRAHVHLQRTRALIARPRVTGSTSSSTDTLLRNKRKIYTNRELSVLIRQVRFIQRVGKVFAPCVTRKF